MGLLLFFQISIYFFCQLQEKWGQVIFKFFVAWQNSPGKF
jgi:hypothetical protein